MKVIGLSIVFILSSMSTDVFSRGRTQGVYLKSASEIRFAYLEGLVCDNSNRFSSSCEVPIIKQLTIITNTDKKIILDNVIVQPEAPNGDSDDLVADAQIILDQILIKRSHFFRTESKLTDIRELDIWELTANDRAKLRDLSLSGKIYTGRFLASGDLNGGGKLLLRFKPVQAKLR